MNWNDVSDDVLMAELGKRLARYRLNKNMTQAQLAEEAGVSKLTVLRLENGQGTQTDNLFRIIRSLGLLENMDAFVPKPAASPIEQLKLQGKVRKRASTSQTEKATENPDDAWSWGDDE